MVIAEMTRVARRAFFIGFPNGKEAEKFEHRARKVCEAKIAKCRSISRKRDLIRRSAFLQEHLKNGLPEESEVLMSIRRAMHIHGSSGDIRIIENQSVWLWYLLALGSVRTSVGRWFLTTAVAMIFLPLLRQAKWGGCYRKIFVVTKRAGPHEQLQHQRIELT
jgi:hypothetical protein